MAYRSFRQESTQRLAILLRTRGNPLALVKPLEHEVASLDPNIPLQQPTALEAALGQALAPSSSPPPPSLCSSPRDAPRASTRWLRSARTDLFFLRARGRRRRLSVARRDPWKGRLDETPGWPLEATTFLPDATR